MSCIHLQNVEVLNHSSSFSDPYIFKITFECISELQEDIEWKLIYVGSAEDEKYDQELDNCLVGPVPVGVNSFEFEAEAPSPSKLPAEDLLGVTVILLTGSYRDQEFIRVGYYVNNEYEDEELRENPPEKVDLTKVRREVLVTKPRVTRFNIKWDTTTTTAVAPTLPGESSDSVSHTAEEASLSAPPAGASASSISDEKQAIGASSSNSIAASSGASTSSFKPVSVS